MTAIPLIPAEQAVFDRELARLLAEPNEVNDLISAEVERVGLAAAIEEGELSWSSAERAIEAVMDRIPGLEELVRIRFLKLAVMAYMAAKGWPRDRPPPVDRSQVRDGVAAAINSAYGRAQWWRP